MVHGLVRRSSSFNTSRLDHLREWTSRGLLHLHHSDLVDTFSLSSIVSELKPAEVYNLAAQSQVRVSFEIPMTTAQVTGTGTLAVLEAVRLFSPESRVYQASSSEMFGSSPPPQSEETPFHPRSPYGVSKVFSYWIARNYREAYGLHISNGILFNHESPRRSPTFVTRKLTRAAAQIAAQLENEVVMGNLDAIRDWGYAPEYVVGMWMMLQKDTPGDYVLGTGVGTSVREWAEASFHGAGLKFDDFFRFDERYTRPSEVESLLAAPEQAKIKLGWVPSTSVSELRDLMLTHDMDLIHKPQLVDKVKSSLWIQHVS